MVKGLLRGMEMPVVQVGHMMVGVKAGRVRVKMGMLPGKFARMFVLAMAVIMGVGMCVHHRFAYMAVLVLRIQQQERSKTHQG